jgi:hypothetical protein
MGFNMTPKEKAKELVLSYYNVNGETNYDGISWGMAKQCALIAVDEIINCTKNGLGVTVYSKEYWEEVKKEIEEL